MMALLLTAAMRPVRIDGALQADSAFALSVTNWPTLAVLGMTLSDRPGTSPAALRFRAFIQARAPGMSGASSRASVARSLASSARVSASDDSAPDDGDAPPASRLNELLLGVRLATAVAAAPL